jgi:hypothetical protein
MTVLLQRRGEVVLENSASWDRLSAYSELTALIASNTSVSPSKFMEQRSVVISGPTAVMMPFKGLFLREEMYEKHTSSTPS